MDFDDFEISQEDLSRIDNIEITLLNQSFQISSDEDDNIQLLRPRRRRIILSDNESSETEINRAIQDLAESSTSSTWTDPKGNQRQLIAFTEIPGAPLHIRMLMTNNSPAEFYALLVTDDVLNEIVKNTIVCAI